MKRKRKKLSGFTLVELIVVLAIFSGICVGALAMISPAMRIFDRASTQEEATADIDNIARYIQDNLRFANRVNIYHGYNVSSPSDLVGLNIGEVLPYYEKSVDTGQYEIKNRETNPLEFFIKYYYGDDTTEKNFYIMEIQGKPDESVGDDNRTEGMVTIYNCNYKCDPYTNYELYSVDTANPVSVINDEFYDDYGFSIKEWTFDTIQYSLKIDMDVEYKGTVKDDSGERITLNQQESMNLTFLNAAHFREFGVEEKVMMDDGKLLTKNRTAAAYRNFILNPGDTGYYANSNTYIIYTVPEIIVP